MSPGISVIISLHGVQAVMHAGRGPACGGGREVNPPGYPTRLPLVRAAATCAWSL